MSGKAIRETLAALGVIATLSTLGCGDEGPQIDLSGTWTFTDSLLNWPTYRSPRCRLGLATLTVTQVGTTLTGGMTDENRCMVVDTTNVGDRSGSIVGGVVANGQVSFEVAFCEYQATTSGSPPTQMTGTEVCLLHLGGTDSVFYDGPWRATR